MTADQRRAGYWRRLLSLTTDAIVVFLPFQILAAVLFALTAGSIQFADGLTFTACKEATQLPTNLSPAPPANANSASECRIFFFGAETARRLTVRRMTKEGNTTYIVAQQYMLDKNSNQVNGYSLEWIAILTLIGYLILAKSLKGKTLGDRATKIAVVNTGDNFGSPVPLKKLVVRYLILAAPIAPVVLVQGYFLGTSGNSANQLATSGFLTWFLIAAAPAFVLYFICVVQIARKRDPLYDRIAKTAVIRASWGAEIP